jgi:hypothetical protein
MNPVRRYRLWHEVHPVEITAQDVALEGPHRLRPGQYITLTHVPTPTGVEDRVARVDSWTVATLGRDGTTYRGICRWLESRG